MKNRTKKRLTSLLIVAILLLLTIPAGALFAATYTAETTETNETEAPEATEPSEPTDPSEPAESEEPDETTGESASLSEQALYIAERNATAESLGIPPGRLNNIDKLAEISGMTREEVLAIYADSSIQDIQKEIQRYRSEAAGKETKPANGHGNGHNKG